MCRDEENGAEGIGRHAKVIQLGRNIWQRAPLNSHEQSLVEEDDFDDGSLPPAEEVLKAAREAVKEAAEAPAPFAGRTAAAVSSGQTNYSTVLDEWFAKIRIEEEKPNSEQLAVLQAARERILQEVALEKEGPES